MLNRAVRDELRFLAKRLPYRDLYLSFLFLCALLIFNVPFLKALTISLLIFICSISQMGRRTLIYVGWIVIPYAFAVWIGAMPQPHVLRDWLVAVGRTLAPI